MTTKLDEEIGAVKKTVTGAAGALRDNIDAAAPHWLINIIYRIVDSPATPWFMIGAAVEAFGITLQFMFLKSSYPIADFVFGGAIGIGLLYWQGRRAETE